MKEVLYGIARHVLTIAGTAVGMDGLASDSNVQLVVGVVLLIVSVGGSWWNKRNVAKKIEAAQ